MKRSTLLALLLWVCHGLSAQTYSVILGRPTASSVTASILFSQDVTWFLEYGTQPGVYGEVSGVVTATANRPDELDLQGLLPDTKYYYRLKYKTPGAVSWLSTPEYSLHTQRPRGKTFTFVIEADPHLDSNTDSSAYRVTLRHMLSQKPDFMIDLGDNFMTDKLPVINQQTITDRHLLFRNFYHELCPSAPLYLVLGNHEGEYRWVPASADNTMPVMATNIRKQYYPNPFPNGFYSGNTTPENLVGLRENYYSWEWGDALFIVLDPYWYTTTKSVWGWTLGIAQYNWLKQVISTSTARYKFVFCHQLVSGNGIEGRGGSESVPYYEMGGKNADGSYGFGDNRPGWDQPVHALLKQYGCNIFFHGHDHLFARQELDNIVYQEVPQPSAKNITYVTGTEPGYGYANGILLPNRGYMRVIVSPDSVKVDYMRTYLPAEENAGTHNGDIAYSYTIKKTGGAPVISSPELVRVFPNPARQQLNIQYLANISAGKVRLINAEGKTLLTTSGTELNISGIASGVYFLDIVTSEFKVRKKVVIAH